MVPRMLLDPEEAAEARAAEAAEAAAAIAAGEPAEKSIRIYRLLRYFPYILAAALAAIVWQLGSLLGALAIVAAAGLFAVLRPKLVDTYRYDDERLFLNDDAQPLDWDRVAAIRLRWWSPLAADYEYLLIVRQLDLRITLRDGSTIRFARGGHFHRRPHRPANAGHFERFLKKRARAAGMVVEKRGRWEWVAHRARDVGSQP